MSLFGSLFTGVSALAAQSSSMGVISNNIANVSTVGYKANYSDFSSLVTNATNSGAYSPGGVLAHTQKTISSQGTLQQTNSSTAMAISGNGFFIVRPEPASTSPIYYTRAGSFSQDSDGYLRNSSGMVLYGWALDQNGNPPAAVSDINSLTPVNVSFLGGQTKPTTTANLSINVNATTATGGTFARNMTVYDSLGSSQSLTMTFTKTSTANTWTLRVQNGATDLLPAPGTVNVLFNTDGTISQVGATAGVKTLTVAGAGGGGIAWGNGSAAQSIVMDLSSVTQYASANNVVSISQNGAALGLRTGVEVDENGIVSATFSNGTTAKIYQLPIATFSNPNGLQEVSGNAYAVASASGDYNLRAAGASGAGKISPSSLEESNVDLADEFSKMIVTQRAYSAGTKVITTVDQMLQELLNAR